MSEPPLASSWAAPPEFYLDENVAGKTAEGSSPISATQSTLPLPCSAASHSTSTWPTSSGSQSWGVNGWVVIGRDQRILSRKDELRAYLDAQVHLFLLPGEVTRQQIVSLLHVNLREMCTLASARTPNVYWLTRGGVEPYEKRVSRRARRRHR